MSHRRLVAVAVAAAATVLVAGCGAAPVDRAGGDAGQSATVLTFGQPGVTPAPALQAWADQVKVLSRGALRIDFKDQWRNGATDFETGTVQDVRSGKVDVAMVGARVFDRFGVTSYHALLAPMLVDSQALQAKLFAAGIPDAMGRHLEPAGIVSLGALPGPMRKILGVTKPFLRPSDFTGAVVGIQDSALTVQTLTALGARTTVIGPGNALDGLDGYEQQLASIVGNNYAESAKYVTANLNLWPRPLVIITSPKALQGLSREQRRALTEAINAARPVAQQTAQKEDFTSAPTLCSDGMQLPAASAQDLAALSAALEPVLDKISAEPGSSTWLEQIRDLKRTLGAGPDSETCPATNDAGVQTPIPDGTYKREQIKGEAVAGCPPNDDSDEARSFLLLKLDNGRVTVYSLSSARAATPEVGWLGTYRVFRDRIDFSEYQTGIVLSATWTLDGKTLTLGDMKGGTCGDANVWTARPWTRVT